MAPIEATAVFVPGTILLTEIDGKKIRGIITFNSKYRWRFTASNLHDQTLPYFAIFKKIGAKWMDAIALPNREDGYRERYPITRVLSEMLARAFGRTESAFDGQPIAIIETTTILGIEGASVALKILVLPSSSCN